MSTTSDFREAPFINGNYTASRQGLSTFDFSPSMIKASMQTLETRSRKLKETAKFAGGSLDTTDLIETWRLWKGTVLEYQKNDLGQQVQMLLDAANTNTAEQISLFAEIDTMRFALHGDKSTANFVQMDAAGIPEAEKAISYGGEQGFALRRFGCGLQWSNDFWRGKSMGEFAACMAALLTADKNLVAKRIRKAIFNPTNYMFVDVMKGDKARLPVRAGLNADNGSIGGNWAIYPAPYAAVTFNDSAHNHYMTCGTGNGESTMPVDTTQYFQWAHASSTPFTRFQNLNQMLYNLREHYNGEDVELFINYQDANTYWSVDGAARTDTGNAVYGFKLPQRTEIIDQRTVQILSTQVGYFDPTNIFEGLVGYFDSCRIQRKVWVPQGYIMAYCPGKPKPVQIRVPEGSQDGSSTSGASTGFGNGDLRNVFEYSDYPLHSQAMMRDFEANIGSERANLVILDHHGAGSNVAYTIPVGLT